MLTTRIQELLSGYRRTVSNTEQFIDDVSKIDKFIAVLRDKKDYIKVRNKHCELAEVFDLDVVDKYIMEYHLDALDEDSVELYATSFTELKNLLIKNKVKVRNG